jgi:hypothetical protein
VKGFCYYTRVTVKEPPAGALLASKNKKAKPLIKGKKG